MLAARTVQIRGIQRHAVPVLVDGAQRHYLPVRRHEAIDHKTLTHFVLQSFSISFSSATMISALLRHRLA